MAEFCTPPVYKFVLFLDVQVGMFVKRTYVHTHRGSTRPCSLLDWPIRGLPLFWICLCVVIVTQFSLVKIKSYSDQSGGSCYFCIFLTSHWSIMFVYAFVISNRDVIGLDIVHLDQSKISSIVIGLLNCYCCSLLATAFWLV